MLSYTKFLSSLLLSVFLVTCTSGAPTTATKGEDKKVFEGDLTEQVEKVYFNKKRDILLRTCDLNDRNLAKILANELQSRKGEIENFLTKQQAEKSRTDKSAEFTKIGKFYFQNSKEGPQDDEWIIDSVSWNKLYQTYLEIKDQPVNAKWISLDNSVRGMMLDEESRVLHSANYGFGRQSEKTVKSALAKIDSCLKDSDCQLPEFKNDELAYIESGYAQSAYYNALKFSKNLNNEERTEYLTLMKNFSTEDLKFYRFTLNPLIKRQDDRLIVPIDATTFEDSAGDLKAFLENFWRDHRQDSSGTNLRVEISLVNQPATAVLIVINDEIGRAFVDSKLRTMNLYKNTRLKSIAHEFGHVLGLKDKYYTTYDHDSCSYKIEFNPGDLMSESDTGVILPQHWEELSKHYVKEEKK